MPPLKTTKRIARQRKPGRAQTEAEREARFEAIAAAVGRRLGARPDPAHPGGRPSPAEVEGRVIGIARRTVRVRTTD